MLVRLKHIMDFKSLNAVYTPTKMCYLEEKEMSYAKLKSIVDHFPLHDTLIILGDFNISTGTEGELATSFVLVSMALASQSNPLFPFEFNKVQKAEHCWFLVPETRASPLDLVQQCWHCAKRDRPHPYKSSLEDPPGQNLISFPECRFLCERPQTCCKTKAMHQVQKILKMQPSGVPV